MQTTFEEEEFGGLERWKRTKKMKENGNQMDELRCLSNYSDTSDLESGQVNITQNQVNGEVKRHLDHQQKIQ